ncbi:MAG: CusA/CzcA family heavy metal efflux RND transporter [candidate division Zixibacteria bacterium]|nr:CusA/CzcA family heavy metal efflux RND transporter [candidate division Zixibacteria bacterium]
MLHKLIDFTLQRRWFILALAGLLIVLGTVALFRLPFDAFPDTTPVMVQVNVSAPGWSPEEVERQITYPVERELSGLSGLTEVRSISKFGLCQVNLIFEDRIDVYLARQQVTERLVSVELPDGVESPRLGPVSTGLGEVLQYVVISSADDPTDARTVQDWIIKPQLQSVPGVAEINSWGGFEKQYQILFDPNRVVQYGLRLEEIVEAVSRGVRNVSGGEMVRGGEQTVVQGVGQVSTREEIEALVLESRDGVPIRVQDIADVVVGHEIRRGAATHQGNGEVVLGLGFMLTGENSHDVTQRMVDRLNEITQSLPPGVEVKPVYARTDLVDNVLDTVKHNLFYGAILVIAVLFAFLGNFRAGLIVASAIPLSMLFAFDLMTRFGIAGSLMSLGAIDFGLAVDNAVIQVENAVSRLQRANNGQPRLDVLRNAILEVRKPTLFGELIIMLVYLPILTLEGVEGKMFRPMAMTVIFVLLGSLILSFTVLPALLGAFLRSPKQHAEPRMVLWLQRHYRIALDWSLNHRTPVIAMSLVLLVAGMLLFNRLGSEFVPRLNEGTIAVNFVKLAGISLEQSKEYGNRVEQLVKAKFPDEIDQIWTRTGTAELSTDPMGLEVSDLFITLTPRERWTRASSQQELVALIDAEVNDLPGMNRVFTQPIEMRVNEMIAGIRADLGIKIFGDDLNLLEEKAEEISALIETIPGSADVTIEQLTGQPVFQLAVDRRRLSRHDLPASEVLSYIEAIGGIQTGELYEGQRRFDLVMKLDSSYIEVPEDVERIPLQSRTGAQLTLDQVTVPALAAGPASITREWGKRRAIVQTNVRGRDIGSFVDEVRDRIAKQISLPPGYFVRYGGQFENLERAQARLAIVVPLALLLILGLLYWTYGSLRDAILIFSGVPLAALGGVIALTLRGMPFSISAGVGFITLSGIAVLNGLVLVSSIKRMRTDGLPLESAIAESAVARLRPVMMTALVAAIGFLPMAVSASIGAEVQRPLATVVIGGVLTSTALTLFILPVLYSLFGRKSMAEA